MDSYRSRVRLRTEWESSIRSEARGPSSTTITRKGRKENSTKPMPKVSRREFVAEKRRKVHHSDCRLASRYAEGTASLPPVHVRHFRAFLTHLFFAYFEKKADSTPFDGATGNLWLDKRWRLIDDDGYFTQKDGSRSRVVHQFDRYGEPFKRFWLDRQSFVHDTVPDSFVISSAGNSSTKASLFETA